METIGDRIKQFAKDKYGSVSGLTREMGIGVTSLANYINGRSRPGAELQEKLRKLGADVEWIMTGKEVATARAAWERAWYTSGLATTRTIDPPEGTFTKLMLSPAHCGDSVDIEEGVSGEIDMSKFHNKNTFYVQATGSSMTGADIHEGDMLLVDPKKEPRNGNIVLVSINGMVSVKRLKKNGEEVLLTPEHPDYDPIPVTRDVQILAVVLRADKYL